MGFFGDSYNAEGDMISTKVDGNNNVVIVNSTARSADEVNDFELRLSKNIRDKISLITGVRSYQVFIFYPTEVSKEVGDVIRDIVRELDIDGIDIVRGGELDGDSYPHILDVNHVTNKECDCIIFIATDILTFSQLSLVSFIGLIDDNPLLDVIVIPEKEIVEEISYLREGPISFCASRKGGVYFLSDLIESGINPVIERIKAKRLTIVEKSEEFK